MPQSSLLDNLRMSLIPEQNFTIHTHLRAVEVMHRLRRITDLPNLAFMSSMSSHSNRPYSGDVSRGGFVLTQKKGLRGWSNRFALQITGHTQTEGDLTVVEIKMEMDGLTKAWVIVWYVLIGLFALLVSAAGLHTADSGPDMAGLILTPLAVIAIFGIPSAILFNIQFGIATMGVRQRFEELLKDIERG